MSNEKTIRQFVSKAEAARRLGLSIPAIYRQIRLGTIPTNERGLIPKTDFEVLHSRLNSDPSGDAP